MKKRIISLLLSALLLMAALPASALETVPWENPFEDVTQGDWFCNDVEFAVTTGLFDGTSAKTFDPAMSMTRAMFVTVLWGMGGELIGDMEAYDAFIDVDDDDDHYYESAVAWALTNGIISINSERRFYPEEKITREQAVALLYCFDGLPTLTAGQLEFDDAADLSDWAWDSMVWATTEGIINGRPGGVLDPQGAVTRAEVAALLHRYHINSQTPVFSQESDLPGGTTHLAIEMVGEFMAEGAEEAIYYVKVKAWGGEGEEYAPISHKKYIFELHPDPVKFNASVWHPHAVGTPGPEDYYDAADFYTNYYWLSGGPNDKFYGAHCEYGFEDGYLASLIENRGDPGIDLNTGEPTGIN